MVPSMGAGISFSIFMASRIITGSPALTVWPCSTRILRIVPGMGETMLPADPPDAGAGEGGGVGAAAGGAIGCGRGGSRGNGCLLRRGAEEQGVQRRRPGLLPVSVRCNRHRSP
jgi:hypothetical protein